VATVTAYPFNGVPTTEDQYAAIASLYQDPGVIDVPGGGALKVTADGSGMKVKVADGSALHSGFRATVAGGDAQVTIAAADASARVDRIFLRIDPATNTASLVSLKPTDTPYAYDVLLANVTVPAGAVVVSGSNVADVRQFVGMRVGMWATRPTGRNAMGYNTTTGRWEYTVNLGATWTALTLQVIVADSVPGTVTQGALLLVRQS
jgi:hypothetical protein